MNNKTKYTLPILIITALVFSVYNDNNELTGTSFDSVELKYAKRFFGIGILCTGLYLFNKNWRNLLIKIMIGTFSISLALNLYIFPGIYESVQINKKYAEYSEIKTCKEMEKRFLTDLKNEEIFFFQFGIGYDTELAKTLMEKYKIESIGMGCIVQHEMECYNQLVNNHLKEKYNDGIIDY